jgi:cell wall-associated NlpC family hydrolase
MREVPQSIYADLIGVPFLARARGPAAFDCFGLVLELQRRLGVDIPNNESPEQSAAHAVFSALELHRWERIGQQPGAVVLFDMPFRDADGRRRLAKTHCGVVINPLDFIHSWEQTGGCTTERLSEWNHRIAGFYRFKTAP